MRLRSGRGRRTPCATIWPYLYATCISRDDTLGSQMHSKTVRQRAITLYATGLSSRETAARLRRELGVVVTYPTVARWVRQVDENRPVGDRRTAHLPKEAARMYESGSTLNEVAMRFRVFSGTRARALQRNGRADPA